MARGRYALSLLGLLLGLAGTVVPPAMAQDATTGSASDGGLRPATITAATPSVSDDKLVERVRRSKRIATRMARYEWLDKAAQANPNLLPAICMHSGAARILAQHKHIAALAEIDPYLCRRITRFRRATDKLIQNPHVDAVIQRDPEGIYYAIARDPSVGRVLSGHTMFDEMVIENPDLARVIVQHMK